MKVKCIETLHPFSIFMDEIMNGLAPVNVELVRGILQGIKEGKVIIFASHLLDNFDDYADQI